MSVGWRRWKSSFGRVLRWSKTHTNPHYSNDIVNYDLPGESLPLVPAGVNKDNNNNKPQCWRHEKNDENNQNDPEPEPGNYPE